MVLTVSFGLSPVIGLFCHRRLRDHHPASLTSASRCQDHTTPPSASAALVCRDQRRPSHPAPNVRDDREAPLLIEHRTRGNLPVICPTSQASGLRHINATGKSLRARQTLSSESCNCFGWMRGDRDCACSRFHTA